MHVYSSWNIFIRMLKSAHIYIITHVNCELLMNIYRKAVKRQYERIWVVRWRLCFVYKFLSITLNSGFVYMYKKENVSSTFTFAYACQM